jgi:NTP pyrophosphatase (non-canonical NTP hydrolase)
VFAEVAAERERQDARFGAERILGQSRYLRVTVLMEEVGELARAVLEHDEDAIRAEAIQVAAVAVALVESLDRPIACADSGSVVQRASRDSE